MASDSSISHNKLEAVMEWLKVLFNDEPIPKFEITEDCIEKLHELMLCEKSLTQCKDLYAKFAVANIDDYTDDFKYITRMLHSLGLRSEVTDGVTELETKQLASVAQLLSLSNVEESSYAVGMTDLLMQKEKTTAEVNALRQSVDNNQSELVNITEIIRMLEILLNNIQTSESSKKGTIQAQARDTDFLVKKVAKYASDKREFDEKIAASGLTSGLTHSKLVGDFEDLKQLTLRLEATKEKIEMYANLPPDKELAQVKLAVSRLELEELEDSVSKQIDMFHL